MNEMMNAQLAQEMHGVQARRTFLRRSGIGSAALLGLIARDATGAGSGNAAAAGENRTSGSVAGTLQRTHFPPRVKRVIHLCMAGGPSHLETLDFKPELKKRDGQAMPASFTDGQPIAQLQGKQLKVMGPQHEFLPSGESGHAQVDD
ncbi:MAG: DUF1501 domain-containing protein, partial [Planctomycetota bacterium]